MKQMYDNEIDAIDNEIKRLQLLKQSKKRAQDNINHLIITNMNRLGLTEIKTPTRILKITNSVSTEIYDIYKLPTEYRRTKIDMIPDKVKIKEDIKKGKVVDGARLVQTQSLRIR